MANSLADLASQYTWQSVVSSVSGSIVLTPFQADAKRVALLISNGGPGTIQVNFGPPADLTTPIYAFPNQRPIILRFAELGPLIQQQINLIAPGTAGTGTFISIIKNS